jgi:hypothetical protein
MEDLVCLWTARNGKPGYSTDAGDRRGGPFIRFCLAVVEAAHAHLDTPPPAAAGVSESAVRAVKAQRRAVKQRDGDDGDVPF